MHINKSIIRLFVFLLSISGVCYKSIGQTNPIGEVQIASPTAAALGKYADYPVSYQSGTPNISIPIYSVKSGNLELPISLSYHASGLKVQELASWVGAGWSLNAGGVITRSVIGQPDDRGLSAGSSQTRLGHWSDYGYNNYLTESGTYNDALSFANGNKDGEPDMYFFNFGKFSGKFYFRDDRTPILVPQQDFKIIPDYGAINISTPSSSINGTCFRGFTIITSDGVQYYFGATKNSSSVIPVELTSPYTADEGFTNGSAISSWYLNKIVSKDGLDAIVFNYQQENYSYYTISMFPLINTHQANEYEYKPIKQYIVGVRLSSITVPSIPGFSCSFLAGTTPRKDVSDYSNKSFVDQPNTTSKPLGSIQISNGAGLCKKYSFSYGYFSDGINGLNGQLSNMFFFNTIQSDSYKLRLDAVHSSTCDDSTSMPPYTFTYFNEQVPRLLSFGIDHWGYYNGVTTNNTLIPTYTVNTSTTVVGAERDARWPAMRGGTLQQITYPTGGNTIFDFEPHDTYKSKLITQKKSVAYMSVLYFNSSNIDTKTFTTSATTSGLFTLEMYQGAADVTGIVTINDANGKIIKTFAPATSDTYPIELIPSTTYSITLRGYSNRSTSTTNLPGFNATISEYVSENSFSNVKVGGLRIKTITNHDPITGQDISTNYSYTSGTQSSGVLYSLPSYVSILRNDEWGKIMANCDNNNIWSPFGCATPVGGGFQAAYLVSPSSIRTMTTSQGNHIGYNEVRVAQSGNGYSIYRFYGFSAWENVKNYPDVAIRNVNPNICDGTVASFPYAPIAFDFINGELKYEGYFNRDGQLLKETTYIPQYTQDQIGTPGLIVKNQGVISGGGMFRTEYMLYSASKTQDKKIETNYDPATRAYITTTNTTNYASSFHHQPTQKSTLNSAGDNLISNIKYAFDYRIASCDAIDNGYLNYLNSISSATTQFNDAIATCTPINCNQSSCRYIATINFRMAKANARISYLNWQAFNFSNTNSTYNINRAAAKTNADAELKPILELQDEFDNAVIETTNFKNNKLLSASFTKYDYGSNPSTIVYPKRTQIIPLAAPSTTFTSSAISSNGSSISKDVRYMDESFFSFNAGRLVSVKQKGGIINTYLWGYNNQYPVAKISGSDYATASALVNSAVINDPISDVALRTELAKLNNNLSPVLVTTYTYAPFLGMTSQTDPSGHTSYFDYDGLARLKSIRDQNNNFIKQYEYGYRGSAAAIAYCTITCTNYSAANPYSISLTPATGNGQTYSFQISQTGSVGIGIPAGYYNVTINSTNLQVPKTFIVNGIIQSGVTLFSANNLFFSSLGVSVSIN